MCGVRRNVEMQVLSKMLKVPITVYTSVTEQGGRGGGFTALGRLVVNNDCFRMLICLMSYQQLAKFLSDSCAVDMS